MPRPSDPHAFLTSDDDPPSKRAILRAALRLFVGRGYDLTSIRDIAAEAGYTNPALFKFFRSKEELGVHLFEKTYRELLNALEVHVREDGPLAEVLAKWADAYVELLSERIDAVLFVHNHLTQFWPRVARRFGNRTLFRLMHDWIQRGREAGRISTAVPLELQTAAVSGFFHQFAKMVHLGEIDQGNVGAMKAAVGMMLVRILTADGLERRGS